MTTRRGRGELSGSTAPTSPWRVGASGCVIVRVRVTPKSSKDVVDGVEQVADGPAIRVRVRAIPAEGEANAAVEKLVAAWLEVPKSRVVVIQGGKSRVKSLEITGEVEEITARLAARLAPVV